MVEKHSMSRNQGANNKIVVILLYYVTMLDVVIDCIVFYVDFVFGVFFFFFARKEQYWHQIHILSCSSKCDELEVMWRLLCVYDQKNQNFFHVDSVCTKTCVKTKHRVYSCSTKRSSQCVYKTCQLRRAFAAVVRIFLSLFFFIY